MGRFASVVRRCLASAGTFLVALWCMFALHFNSLIPDWLATGLAFAFVAVSVWLWRQSENWTRFFKAFVPMVLLVILLWSCVLPSEDSQTTRDGSWSRLHALMPTAEITAKQVTIRNIRNTQFKLNGEYEVQHFDRTYQLADLESIWLGEQHFARFQGIAHTFVSFGFRDGEYLTISVEARRGEGENFSPLRGLFKQFGLIYVVSPEQDAIGRTLSDELPIYLYPIRATQQQVQAMFTHMLQRANELHNQPEFYHTAYNNCASNIVDSFNEIAPIRFSRYSPFIVLPGYSGKVAYEQGLIDTVLDFVDVQNLARINELARQADAVKFSERVRSNFSNAESASDD